MEEVVAWASIGHEETPSMAAFHPTSKTAFQKLLRDLKAEQRESA
jgi:hypothetical protein